MMRTESCSRPKNMILFTSTLLFSFTCLPSTLAAESIKFVANGWRLPGTPDNIPLFKVAYMDDKLNISCQTTHPHAKVELKVTPRRRTPYRSAEKSSNGRILRTGQFFVIRRVVLRDSGYYKCVLSNNVNKLELQKGRLLVVALRRKVMPEIYPSQSVIRIARHGSFNVTCETLGAPGKDKSLLTWYRVGNDGRRKKVQVSNVLTYEERTSGGRTVDVEKLTVKNFSVADAGMYVCGRRLGGTSMFRSVMLELQGVDEKFRFLAKRWSLPYAPAMFPPMKLLAQGKPLNISCQTSDPLARVRLLHYERDVVTTPDSRIKKSGQVFLVKRTTISDSGKYKCVARNEEEEIELKKGRLNVVMENPVIAPEIYPDSGIIHIKWNGEFNVTCKTVGARGRTYLAWYKKGENGKKKVDKKRIHRSEQSAGGRYIEVVVLRFRKFSPEDGGEYVCERHVGGDHATYETARVLVQGA